jgi:hypothetical protein
VKSKEKRKTSVPKVRGPGRIKADRSKQAPNNSYSVVEYYEDLKFKCRDCEVECVWTDEQQRLWYEEWRGPIQSTAVRCRECREKVRRAKIEQKRRTELGRKSGS